MKVYLALLLPIFCLAACGGSNSGNGSSDSGGSDKSISNDFLKSDLTPEQQAVRDELIEAEKKMQQCAKRNPPVCDKEVANYDKIANKACKMGMFTYECEAD